MATYQLKKRLVEAIEFTGNNYKEIETFTGWETNMDMMGRDIVMNGRVTGTAFSKGDFIIRNRQFPKQIVWSANEFHETYELISG